MSNVADLKAVLRKLAILSRENQDPLFLSQVVRKVTSVIDEFDFVGFNPRTLYLRHNI